jgi:hypothetical protein
MKLPAVVSAVLMIVVATAPQADARRLATVVENIETTVATIADCDFPLSWFTVMDADVTLPSIFSFTGGPQVNLDVKGELALDMAAAVAVNDNIVNAQWQYFLRVLVDGTPADPCGDPACPSGVAYPPQVLFKRAGQGVSSDVAGQIVGATLLDGTAYSFGFIVPNISPGFHTIELQAALCFDFEGVGSAALVIATGPGRMTVDRVAGPVTFNPE